MLLKTQGKFANIRHNRSDFSAPIAHTKKDVVQDKQIKALKKKVKKLDYERETKYFDFAAQGAIVVEAGLQLAAGGIAFGIVQGTSQSTRVGSAIQTTSCLFRAQLLSDKDRLGFGHVVRIIAYWDKSSNGAANSTSGTALSLMEGSGTVAGHLDFRNQETIDRFDIIWDKTYTMNAKVVNLFTVATGATTEVIPQSLMINKRFKLGRKITYNANAGAITDLAGNNFCIVVIGNADAEPALISYNMRLYFKDA